MFRIRIPFIGRLDPFFQRSQDAAFFLPNATQEADAGGGSFSRHGAKPAYFSRYLFCFDVFVSWYCTLESRVFFCTLFLFSSNPGSTTSLAGDSCCWSGLRISDPCSLSLSQWILRVENRKCSLGLRIDSRIFGLINWFGHDHSGIASEGLSRQIFCFQMQLEKKLPAHGHCLTASFWRGCV